MATVCASAVTMSLGSLAPVSGAKVASNNGLAMVAPVKNASAFVSNKSRVSMSLPSKVNNVVGLTGLALLAATVVPEIAEAAQPGVSDSLRNLLGSVVAGGVVLVALGGAVAGVSTFDPVKRR